jgi:superfamily I DNA/RNA helicase
VAGRRVADRWEQRFLVRRDIQLLAEMNGRNFHVSVIDDFLTAMGAGFRDEPSAEPELTGDEAILRAAWERVSEFLLLHVFDAFAPDLEQQLIEGRSLPNAPKAIVVDEYQDLTPVELRLIQRVAASSGAGVFACGDDMQSIYGFRDAAVGGLAGFPAQYGTDGVATLGESRRCPKEVIDLAEEVAARVPGREMLAPRPRMTSYEDRHGEVRLRTLPSIVAEARWVVREVARLKAASAATTQPQTIAVIVPGNVGIYLRELNKACEHTGTDVVFSDSRTRLPLGDEDGFRFAYALLRLAADGEDQLAWRTVLSLVPRQPGNRIEGLYASGDAPLTVAMRARAAVDDRLRNMQESIQATVAAIRGCTDRDRVVEAVSAAADHYRVDRADWDALYEVLEQPMTPEEEADLAPDMSEPGRQLLEACRRAVNEVVADRDPQPNEVRVYTVFQAKGQEWHHVFLIGAYRRAFVDRNNRLGEGARLLYVAMTRSMISLTITKYNYGRNQGLVAAAGTPSPAFPSILTEAATAAGVPIIALGPQP